jgi:hypothetical protein
MIAESTTTPCTSPTLLLDIFSDRSHRQRSEFLVREVAPGCSSEPAGLFFGTGGTARCGRDGRREIKQFASEACGPQHKIATQEPTSLDGISRTLL